MAAEAPAAVDKATGKAFASYFKADTPTTTALVQAVEDEQEPVRTLALSAMSTLGEIKLAIPELEQDAKIRPAAIETLRKFGSRNPETAKTLHEQLAQFAGEDWAQQVERLLVGFTPDDAKNAATYKTLVSLLTDQDVGVRTLALTQLVLLSGRDALGYDPDHPEGAGLKAWQDLLRNGDLPRARRARPRKP